MPRSDLERRCRYDVAQSRSRTLSRCVNIADLRKHARRRLPGPVFDFLDGGAEDEVTLARNRLAFSAWALVPRLFRDFSEVSGEFELLGQPLAIGRAACRERLWWAVWLTVVAVSIKKK